MSRTVVWPCSILLSLSWLLAGFTPALEADVFCVDSSEALHEALSAAETNDVDDEIRLVQGNYQGGFEYAAIATPTRLRVSGGYTEGCADRVIDPENTVLEVSPGEPVWTLDVNLHGTFDVSGLTFQGAGGLSVDWDTPLGERPGDFDGSDLLFRDHPGRLAGPLVLVGPIGRGRLARTVASDNESGLWLDANGDAFTVTDLTLLRNSDSFWGGGAFLSVSGDLVLRRITAIGNSSEEGGGALYVRGGISEAFELSDSYFEGNATGGVGGALGYVTQSAAWELRNNVFIGNSSVRGGGAVFKESNVSNGPALVEGNVFFGNTTNQEGGGLILGGLDTVEVIQNQFYANTAGGPGGGLRIEDGLEISVSRSEFFENVGGGGAGISIGEPGLLGLDLVELGSNAIHQNANPTNAGGGVRIEAQFPIVHLTNNTITSNSSISEGGGIHLAGIDDASEWVLANNLVWGNDAPVAHDLRIDNDGDGNGVAGTVTLSNNDFDSTEAGFVSTLPVDIDPSNLNIDPGGLDPGDGNLRLGPFSPLIDAGTGEDVDLGEFDLDGHVRVVDGDADAVARVDIGAYEYDAAELLVRVTGACPGELLFEVAGATPEAEIYLGFGPTVGEGTFPVGNCSGVGIDLVDPDLLAVVIADERGRGSYGEAATEELCGLSLQLIDDGNCARSSVARIP